MIGTGTAKLAKHLAGLVHKPLFQVFLIVQHSYDSLDRERCIELLRGYGLGTNLAQILDNYWQRQRIVPNVGKYLVV